MSGRPEKLEYYLSIAREVSRRSTCLRRRFGAVVLKDDQVISTGYGGAPRGTPNCTDLGKCAREDANIPPGERYELCRSVHAEANAIINAARAGVSLLGGILYLYGENVKDGSIAEAKPCKMCKRMLINAGIETVIVKTPSGKKLYDVSEWIKSDNGLYGQKDLEGY